MPPRRLSRHRILRAGRTLEHDARAGRATARAGSTQFAAPPPRRCDDSAAARRARGGPRDVVEAPRDRHDLAVEPLAHEMAGRGEMVATLLAAGVAGLVGAM